MIRSVVLAFAVLATTAAIAQPAPPAVDPALLQRALNVLQAQRNQAMDSAAIAEARAAGLTDDLAKANARIKELEPKPASKK